MDKASLDPARSLYYGLFSKMFVFTTQPDRYAGVSEALDVLIEHPLDNNSGEALRELKAFIDAYGYGGMVVEYDAIFHEPISPVVRTTASYYLEGFESGMKTVEVRNFLAKTRIRRNENEYKEPEDSIGFLMTFMHELIELIIEGHESYLSLHQCLFDDVINPFIDVFTERLYEHDKANAYQALAIVLRAFMTFERLYFEIQAPKEDHIITPKGEQVFIADEEAKRRAANRAAKAAESLTQSCEIDVSTFEDEAGLESIE
jgi:TorA maturation chaperone TorD